MRLRKLIAALTMAGSVVAFSAIPAHAARPLCPGGSYINALGIVVCLK